jgi:hypothetical protein
MPMRISAYIDRAMPIGKSFEITIWVRCGLSVVTKGRPKLAR